MSSRTDVTIALLVRRQPGIEVLLGWKKRGIGHGMYAGFGGKVESGETAAEAAAREIREETGVNVAPADLTPLGQLGFEFPARPAWDEIAHVFLVSAWQGEPVETDEMKPTWFPLSEIPFDQMWGDYCHWLLKALEGKKVAGNFVYAADNKTITRVDGSIL